MQIDVAALQHWQGQATLHWHAAEQGVVTLDWQHWQGQATLQQLGQVTFQQRQATFRQHHWQATFQQETAQLIARMNTIITLLMARGRIVPQPPTAARERPQGRGRASGRRQGRVRVSGCRQGRGRGRRQGRGPSRGRGF